MGMTVDAEPGRDDLAEPMRLARGQACDDRQVALAEVERLLFGRTGHAWVGRYRIGERLGTGGQGTVWRAHDPELGRDVAVKLIHRTAAMFSRGEDRLLREARALAQVSHPNVLEVLDVGMHDGRLFMVTAWAGGPDARRWLEARPRGMRERASVVRDMARGLLAVHELGLLHRDVKPANVFVTPTGRALLGDFGLARAWDRSPSSSESLEITPAHACDGSVTDPSAGLGTPAYVAPEQHLGAPASEVTDRYALCVSAWEILFGLRPFEGASLAPELLEGRRARPERLLHQFYLEERLWQDAEPLEQISLRTERYNLIHNRKTDTFELYDWRKDYFEQRDLADAPAHRASLQALKQQLALRTYLVYGRERSRAASVSLGRPR